MIDQCFERPTDEVAFYSFRTCLEALLVAQFGILCSSNETLSSALDQAFVGYSKVFISGRRAHINYPNYFAGMAFAALASATGTRGMDAFWRDLLGGDPTIQLEDARILDRLNVLLFMGISALSRCCQAYILMRCSSLINSEQVFSIQALTRACPNFDVAACRQRLRSMVRGPLGLESLTRP
jgi:hypothetical protein